MIPEVRYKIPVRRGPAPQTRFCVFGYPQSCARAMTLIEIIISLAITAIIFAVIVPQFAIMRNNWDSKQAAAETLQNGRILIDHLNRNLSKAVEITAISDSLTVNGYIQFLDNDSNNLRYEVVSSYVQFGVVGSLSDLAGPVSQLQFSCYDACDLDTPLSSPIDVNSIRLVKVETILANSSTLGQDKTFTAWPYLRTNSDGLVGRWKLDETSGLTAVDSGIFDNNGTLTNMVGDEWTTGRMGGALAFDGTNDYVTIPDGAYIHMENLSIAFWVKTSQTGSDGEWYKNPLILEKDTPGLGNDGFGAGLYNQKLEFVIGDSVLTSNRYVSDGAWHHIVLTKDSSKNTAIYIDGNLDKSGVAIYNFTNTVALHIAKPLQGAYFNGTIDDVRIYNRVLSAEEILTLSWEMTKGTNFEFDADRGEVPVLAQIDDSHYLCAYIGEGSDGYAVVLTVDTDTQTITKGTTKEYSSKNGQYPALAKIDTSHYLCGYRGPDSRGYAAVVTVDTDTWEITKETPLIFDPAGCKYPALAQIDDSHYLCAYQESGSVYDDWAMVLTVNTDTWEITKETELEFDTSNSGEYALAQIDNSHYLCVYEGMSDSLAVVLTVDTDTWEITRGTPFEYTSQNNPLPDLSQIDSTHYLCAYQGPDTDGWATVLIVDIDDWTISKGTDFEFDPVHGETPTLAQIDSIHYLCAYKGHVNPGAGNGWAVILTVNTGDWTVSQEDISLEWEEGYGYVHALAKINDSDFLCAYQGPYSHGWSVVLSMDETITEPGIRP